jgi:hypothetical protein
MLAKHAEEYPFEYNQIRPHEAIAWNRPKDVHQAWPTSPPQPFQVTEILHLLDAGHAEPPTAEDHQEPGHFPHDEA